MRTLDKTMRIYLFVTLFVVVIAITMAAPLQGDLEPLELPVTEGRTNRQKRVTCDLLTFTGFSDNLCAANCLTLGKAGGHCENWICVCRQDTFAELWNQRFG